MELDGSFHNPVVVMTVVIWGTVLALVTVVAVRWWKRAAREEEASRGMVVLVASVLAALYLGTPWVQDRLARVLYRLDSARYDMPLEALRFREGPSAIPASVFALVLGLLNAVQSERSRGRSQAGSRHPKRSRSGNAKRYD